MKFKSLCASFRNFYTFLQSWEHMSSVFNYNVCTYVSQSEDTRCNRKFWRIPVLTIDGFIDQCASCVVLTVVGARNPRSRAAAAAVAPRVPSSVHRRPEAAPAANVHHRVRASFALCAATPRPVNITACVPAKGARVSSKGPSRRARNTCAWLRGLARWISAEETVASSADSKSAWWSAWSRR